MKQNSIASDGKKADSDMLPIAGSSNHTCVKHFVVRSGLDNYKGIKFGEFSNEKENFWFTHQFMSGNYIFIRHSESSIKRIARELSLTIVIIYRDKGFWNVGRYGQHLSQSTDYYPRY